jgi:hypothetical protein
MVRGAPGVALQDREDERAFGGREEVARGAVLPWARSIKESRGSTPYERIGRRDDRLALVRNVVYVKPENEGHSGLPTA